MDRKTILAMILCLTIYVGWQKFYLEPRIPASQTQQTAVVHQNDETKLTNSAPTRESRTRTESNIPAQKVTLPTGTGNAVLSNGGLFFQDWNLKNYKLDISSSAPLVDMKSVTHEDGEISLAFEDTDYAYLNDVRGELTSTPQGALWKYEDDKVILKREFIASEQVPYVDLRVSAEFKGKAPRYAFISLGSENKADDAEAQDRQLLYWTNQSLERVALKDVAQKEVSSSVKYIGASNRYFLMAVVGQSPVEASSGLIQPTRPNAGRISMVYPLLGKSMIIPLRVYFGPKELDILRKVEPTLDHTIDFGWFTVFAYPLLKVLKWLYQFLQNYGLAIIFLTLLLKIATYPLTYKSMKSMKNMAKLQPQLQKIREKYKDDKEALNREMLTMMRSYGYNPMAGCLPILIQMPIFFALYRVLYSSIELYHAPFTLWIQDLSSRDPFYVTPVLLAITMFIQQKLTPNTATDPAQARMMQLMPLIFGAFMLALPSGLTVYMLVNALASIVQQMILNKKLDITPAAPATR